MKNKIIYSLTLVVLIIVGVLVYVYGREVPKVGQNGEINGNYSIASIMALNKPYQCSFSKSDGSSQVSGVMRMAEGKLRGDFDLSIAALENAVNQNPSNFASHLIVINGTASVWTSLKNIGYKSPAAKSANRNASPIDQAQIIGINDKEDYTCSLWNADLTVFELPSGITFLELKK